MKQFQSLSSASKEESYRVESIYIEAGEIVSPGPEEEDMMKSLILSYLRKNWTNIEIISYLRCLECFNPLIDEELALIKMDKITKEVNNRLGNNNGIN